MTNPTRYVLGTLVTMTASFLDETDQPFDPSQVTCEVRLPDNDTADVTASLVHDATGSYEFSYTPTLKGAYAYRVTGSGNCQIAQQGQFYVDLVYTPS